MLQGGSPAEAHSYKVSWAQSWRGRGAGCAWLCGINLWLVTQVGAMCECQETRDAWRMGKDSYVETLIMKLGCLGTCRRQRSLSWNTKHRHVMFSVWHGLDKFVSCMHAYADEHCHDQYINLRYCNALVRCHDAKVCWPTLGMHLLTDHMYVYMYLYMYHGISSLAGGPRGSVTASVWASESSNDPRLTLHLYVCTWYVLLLNPHITIA